MPLLTVSNDRLLLDGSPIDLWGIRTASATMDQAKTDHLIAQLDDYLAHGVNAVTVYYAGCSGGFYDPFSVDGTKLDDGHADRMKQIASACAEKGMILVAGIFYQNAPLGLRDRDAAVEAVRTVTRSLEGEPNVIINIANEQNSKNWGKHTDIFDLRDPDEIIQLCRVVHETDPDRLVGGGGYDHDKNIVIGQSDEVDVLLFDTCNDEQSAECYHRFVRAGIAKPIVNVELFGAWTKTDVPGVFPDDKKACYLREVDAAADLPGLSVFFHSNAWCQDDDNRYDLAGLGTEDDPGIRWYFERVAAARGIR